MSRYIEISLLQRKVRAFAKLQDESAPRTCEAVWTALPLEGPIFHAKHANNEVYTLVESFAAKEPGLENATIFPIPGDLVYFYFPPERVATFAAGFEGILTEEVRNSAVRHGLIDLALFYGRDNFLFSYLGPTPGNVYATITEGLEEMARACHDVWYAGAKGERLRLRAFES